MKKHKVSEIRKSKSKKSWNQKVGKKGSWKERKWETQTRSKNRILIEMYSKNIQMKGEGEKKKKGRKENTFE